MVNWLEKQSKDVVSGQVTDIRVEGPPERTLEFKVDLTNHTDQPLAFLRTHARVRLMNRTIVRGDLTRISHASARAAAVGPGDTHPVRVGAAITKEALHYVEERREGDLEYGISLEVLVSPVVERDSATLGAPRLLSVHGRHGGSFGDGTIPQSDWVDQLRRLGWPSSPLLLEIPAPRTRKHPGAWRRFEEAVDHFRKGHWEETLMLCRKVHERLVIDHESDEDPDLTQLRRLLPDGRKGEHLNNALLEIGKFFHLARHESVDRSGADVRMDRADAFIALELTEAYLRYMA